MLTVTRVISRDASTREHSSLGSRRERHGVRVLIAPGGLHTGHCTQLSLSRSNKTPLLSAREHVRATRRLHRMHNRSHTDAHKHAFPHSAPPSPTQPGTHAQIDSTSAGHHARPSLTRRRAVHTPPLPPPLALTWSAGAPRAPLACGSRHKRWSLAPASGPYAHGSKTSRLSRRRSRRRHS